ncbi:gas vesicle protein [Streptomyces sp. NPDC002328]|uniref:gas vesicle protein GvpO n=1 Tax=Streptomyces sp. NPDC002328 TaxID=3364642 RepID=UPI0036C02910
MANTKNSSGTRTSQASRSSQKKTEDSAPSETSDTSESTETTETEDTRRDEDETVADRPKPMEVLREARAQLAELTGMTAESVSSFAQTEDGWSLEVEVLELERVPDTMSLMASYEVELDPDGQLTGYRRVRRYERGRADAHRRGGR